MSQLELNIPCGKEREGKGRTHDILLFQASFLNFVTNLLGNLVILPGPCAEIHGLQYLSPDHAGLGGW